MESPASGATTGSIAELMSGVVQEGQAFVRAEAALLKVEARETIKLAALYLVLIIASALLLATAISLVAAAWVIAADGSVVAALLVAAAVDVVVSAIAISFMILRMRQTPSSSGTTNASGQTGVVS